MVREWSGNSPGMEPGMEREWSRERAAGAKPLPGGVRPGTAASRETFREGAGRAGSEGGAVRGGRRRRLREGRVWRSQRGQKGFKVGKVHG